MEIKYICFIALAAVTVLTTGICMYIYFRYKKSNNVIYYKTGFWFVSVFSLWFSFLLFVFSIQKDDDGLPIFILSIILALLYYVSWLMSIITFDENGFYSRNIFGVKRYYMYSDVTGIEHATQRDRYHEERLLKIHVGNRKVKVYEKSLNYTVFVKMLVERYKQTHNGKKIPIMKPERRFFIKRN